MINPSDGPTSNHISLDEDLPVPDAPVDYDDPFPDQPSRALNVRSFQLTQHLIGKWYHALRKATTTDPLFDIVSKNSNHASWILMDGLLQKKGRMTVETVHMFTMKLPTKEKISEAKSFALPMNRWHTCEPRNVSNTPLATCNG